MRSTESPPILDKTLYVPFRTGQNMSVCAIIPAEEGGILLIIARYHAGLRRVWATSVRIVKNPLRAREDSNNHHFITFARVARYPPVFTLRIPLCG